MEGCVCVCACMRVHVCVLHAHTAIEGYLHRRAVHIDVKQIIVLLTVCMHPLAKGGTTPSVVLTTHHLTDLLCV